MLSNQQTASECRLLKNTCGDGASSIARVATIGSAGCFLNLQPYMSAMDTYDVQLKMQYSRCPTVLALLRASSEPVEGYLKPGHMTFD